MEIITGVERRRRWRVEDKQRIVAETPLPGASVSAVARRHQVSRGLLTSWRAQARRGGLTLDLPAAFVPVRLIGNGDEAAMPPVPSLAEPPRLPSAERRIELTLPDGTCLRVGEEIGLASLRRVLTALRG